MTRTSSIEKRIKNICDECGCVIKKLSCKNVKCSKYDKCFLCGVTKRYKGYYHEIDCPKCVKCDNCGVAKQNGYIDHEINCPKCVKCDSCGVYKRGSNLNHKFDCIKIF